VKGDNEMKVKNMVSERSNRPVANQFIIEDEESTYFQSYDTMIVRRMPGGTFLDVNAWDYSKTTGRYRNQFLGETKKETERKLADGIYKLVDLNR